MASIIRIKRSGSTGSPTSLAQGEMAYSYLIGTESNGGDRLYIGTGTETNGAAANIEVIGGKYFTDKLDHTPGIVTANSALVVDDNKKLDEITIDNIKIDGNTISSINVDGNITLSPNGNGSVDVSSKKITSLGTPTSDTDAATKLYVDSVQLGISGNIGSGDIVLFNETLEILGGTGLTATVANNSITINLDDTAVVAGEYGSSTEIPVFTVDSQGRLTSANTVSVATDLSIAGDTGTDTVSLLSDTLTFEGATGITTAVTNNKVTITPEAFSIGNTNINLAGSTTSLDGLDSIGVGSFSISTNQISNLVTNEDIVISPSGTGNVSVDSSRIINLSDPVNAQDAATKAYVDATAEGLSVKPAVRAATTEDLGGSYDNGTNGVGSTLNLGVAATLTIDGVSSWSLYDGILVKDQINAYENGRYFISQIGDGLTDWVLTRCGKCDEPTEIPSMFVYVQEGTLYNSTGWVATVDTLPMVVGTDDIVFVQFSGAGTYTAGDGLSINGTEFSVNVDNSTIEIVSDSLRVKDSGITNAKISTPYINFAADTGSNDQVDLGQTITIAGGSGIDTTVTDNQISIALNVEAVQDIVGGFTVGGRAITVTYDDGANTITYDADIATTSSLGVASFSSSNFAVSLGGEVTINEIDGGSY